MDERMMQEEQLQAYVFGELSPEEAEAVARAIREDVALQQLETHYRAIYNGLRAERIAHLQAEVMAFDEEQQKQDLAASEKWDWGSRFLMFLAFLTFLLGIYSFGKYHYSNGSLMDRYFILPNDPRVAGSETENQLYQKALEAFFDDQNYLAANYQFTQLTTAAPEYQFSAQFMQAHSLFLANKHPEANASFLYLLNQLEEYPRSQQNLIRWNAMLSELSQYKEIHPEKQTWPASFPVKELEADLDSWFR